jgi:hypothetical protein
LLCLFHLLFASSPILVSPYTLSPYPHPGLILSPHILVYASCPASRSLPFFLIRTHIQPAWDTKLHR